MKNYHTTEIADLIGVHPNTVRFYEAQDFLPQVPRMANGYRIYSEHHLLGLRLIRLAFKAEILSDNLRGEAIDIVKASAAGACDEATRKATLYQRHLHDEIQRAKEAIKLTEQLLSRHISDVKITDAIGRRDAAAQIGVSIDVLRDWERNGLIRIPRTGSRRRYGIHEMNRLKIIAILRSAQFSQMSIRRMLQKLDCGETDLLTALDTPDQTEDIISVADKYITSLTSALDDVEGMLALLKQME